ncbi:NADH-quinone oxidoreductase subunit NuoE family protein [Hellea balneolensis]|uniref:NADH-quinone oxidoreductase subunit NuoE family protein n=1 Tax=Hellea balneolensis TaxID=287478 RepID=UPI0003F4EA4F|nr:NAD(P)H-dependent oxidoreductase subunit E [Hellea balneolensis]
MVTLLNTVEDKFAREACRAHGDQADELLEILHDVQHEKGHLSDSALRTIAQALNISRAEIHGVVSFYHDYKREPGAKLTLHICRAEACKAVGADTLITEAETLLDVKLDEGGAEVALAAAYCLGNCALGPAIMVNDKLYGRVDRAKINAITAKHMAQIS